ncbi:N-alpha-acetyltransferase 50 [Hondaea fermentalgiana]|uniref:N-alpha-acetyltransferase 50 n=1 Tax=Hondaea fermentalgiana TaxID=2315210 RepID=A0A2R5GDY7_9STRA|nr:N-alpha-acetyltransferase 50 [Hondaea fermentalgiana]|eukprot:GBG27938.1 N-alpha-acetyltransferase 50 [Hondaea fermentalgiana]
MTAAADGKKLDTSGQTTQVTKEIMFGPVLASNVGQLRAIQSCLEVNYAQKFYDDVVVSPTPELCKLGLYNSNAVGACCSRLEEREGKTWCYVMTLVVLPAYRGRMIGTKLLEHMISSAQKLGAAGIFLHVWTENPDGIDFYVRKFGFEKKETIEGYYKRLEPSSCILLEKSFPSA